NFEKSLAGAPRFDPARLLLAQCRLAAGDPAKALDALSGLNLEALAQPAAHDLQCRALLASGKLDEAGAAIDAFQKRHPQSAEPYFYRAQLAYLKADPATLSKSVEQGLKLAPQDPRLQLAQADLLWHKGQRDQALLLAASQARSRDQLEASILESRFHLEAGHYSKAASLLRSALTNHPDEPRLYLLLNQALAGLGKNDEAATTLRTAWLRLPQHLDFGFQLAALQEKSNPTEAALTYREILKIQPENPRALNQLAWLLSQPNGDLKEAASLAQRACKSAPDSAACADTRAWIEYQRGDFAAALGTLKAWSKKPPADPYWQLHWGLALWKNNQPAQAKAALQKLLEQWPSFEGARQAQEVLKQISA
ncbi:MAG: tetratricopeptide repeat protein, partial [Verrucomicrobiae bacterium]|nr:tetratricopeptide repeat protein [Verrucomicrobiae bacterium]